MRQKTNLRDDSRILKSDGLQSVDCSKLKLHMCLREKLAPYILDVG